MKIKKIKTQIYIQSLTKEVMSEGKIKMLFSLIIDWLNG